MAKAEITVAENFRKIDRVVTEVVVDRVETVHLSMSREEATFIRDVVGQIAGPTEKSRRKHADAVWAALSVAGVEGTAVHGSVPDFSGALRVKEISPNG